MEKFILKEGIFLSDTSGIESCYSLGENGTVFSSISCEKQKPFVEGALDILKTPLFFFAEIPCTDEEEASLGGGLHKKIYYLDNCTRDVCRAIVKRYGDLLFSDGLLQWGFGSHKDNAEVFFKRYQVLEVFTNGDLRFEKLFEKLSVNKVPEVKTPGSLVSAENPGECIMVDANGETIYDMISNLTEAGMYEAEICDDE